MLTATYFGSILLYKMILYVVMFGIGIVITSMGMKLSKDPTPEFAAKAQKRIKLLSEINIALGIFVIFLAVLLSVGL